jgi:isoamylase
VNWTLDDEKRKLLEFADCLIALRHAHPVFRRRDFFQGRPLRGSESKDIMWLQEDATELTDEEWDRHHARCLGVYFAGEGITETDARGQRIADRSFLVLFNAHHDEIKFRLPQLDGGRLIVVFDTAVEDGLAAAGATFKGGSAYPLAGRSLALLRHAKGEA